MVTWQWLLLVWGLIALLDRTGDIFSRNQAWTWYERVLSAFVYWVMGFAWPYQRIYLPAANWWLVRNRKVL